MYTATVIGKSLDGAAMKFTVEFTNGVTTVSESVIPQDEAGFKYWVKARLATFNSGAVLATTYVEGTTVDVTDVIVTPPTPTQAEVDQLQWMADYGKWIKIKTTLIDTGILTGNEVQVLALKSKVQTNFKPAYLASI